MNKFSLLFLCVSAGFTPAALNPAYALEPLLYTSKISPSSQVLLREALPAPLESFDVAQTDLNDDGLYEFIVHPKDCASTPDTCSFDILAETGDKMVSLGRIQARDIAIDSDKKFGVRSLRAFDNPRNDYSFSLYVWDAARSRYMIEGQDHARK
ncbi:MAG: hypothetical protein KDJ35_01525 [Alphaproteobacteria bacterium]|nr:hypothetical protein [Alphaproteobacteria bacterium]